ncbi:hypothetical protein DMX03_01625 [Pseudomonas koreensis]|nr:hypothetical protein BJN42_00405 [Pseudomonas koreensis]OJT53331.1 hypothetical protein BSZ28_01430 [Pseudomonas moraviensis]PYB92193.1 hypothetical protein DMX03_01625 [Pseudomonas koreensis]
MIHPTAIMKNKYLLSREKIYIRNTYPSLAFIYLQEQESGWIQRTTVNILRRILICNSQIRKIFAEK